MEKKRSYFNLEETLKQAKDKFAGLDPAETADKSGARWLPEEKALLITMLGSEYRVTHPGGQVWSAEGVEASIYTAIIVLHYLLTADGTPLTGRWIAYRHLPGGDIYIDPFNKRAITPFLKTFGERPDKFKTAAASLGGSEQKMSGISMVITVLPRVPICFTIWPGDEEMPASANILFDEAASHYLPTEDYAHLPAIVNGALKSKL
jgi:hypothetical protein